METTFTTQARIAFVAFLTLSFIVPVPAANHFVDVNESNFSPSFLEIQLGDTVTWINRDEFFSHSIVSDNNRWTPGILVGENDTFTLQFNAAGTYDYHDGFDFFDGRISVVSGPVNAAPSITITNPAPDAVFTAPVTFSFGASAEDSDGTISDVEFFVNGASVGNDSNSPYSVMVTNLPAGNYTLTARATDNNGASTDSGGVAIAVVTHAVISAPVVSGGQFTFDITGVSGQSYVVEYSTDLAGWSPLQTITAPSDTFTFSDPEALGTGRFYRVKSQ